jgi:large subunit ribosomal protein L25
MFQLEIEKREAVGKKARTLKAAGKIPAVFYGPKESATPITLSERDFMKVWREAGESSVIELLGMGETKEVLIHDVDLDPVSGEPRHADFYVIEKGKKVRVDVPLSFIGTASAVKDLGGTLVKVLHELEIEVMPKDLPHNLEVDVTSLVNFESQIKVKDITVPSGVEVLTDREEVVALVSEVKEEEEIEVEAPDLSSIEVEKKGKAEDVEAETSASGAEKTEN